MVMVNPGGMPAGSDSGICRGPDVVETLLSEWLLLPLLVGEVLLLVCRFDECIELPPLAAISSFNRLVMWDFICFRRWSLR